MARREARACDPRFHPPKVTGWTTRRTSQVPDRALGSLLGRMAARGNEVVLTRALKPVATNVGDSGYALPVARRDGADLNLQLAGAQVNAAKAWAGRENHGSGRKGRAS